jgi:hypothetical protein
MKKIIALIALSSLFANQTLPSWKRTALKVAGGIGATGAGLVGYGIHRAYTISDGDVKSCVEAEVWRQRLGGKGTVFEGRELNCAEECVFMKKALPMIMKNYERDTGEKSFPKGFLYRQLIKDKRTEAAQRYIHILNHNVNQPISEEDMNKCEATFQRMRDTGLLRGVNPEATCKNIELQAAMITQAVAIDPSLSTVDKIKLIGLGEQDKLFNALFEDAVKSVSGAADLIAGEEGAQYINNLYDRDAEV